MRAANTYGYSVMVNVIEDDDSLSKHVPSYAPKPDKPIPPVDTIISIRNDDPIEPIDDHSTTKSPYAVGSPNGSFSVNGSGAAIYSLKIDMPDGGGLEPSIGVSYNSQSGVGLAGYGFNITGITTITRGCKDLFHDGTVSGCEYDTSDALFLNGQRLILKSGFYGYGGSVYTPEGNPYTKVTLHNTIENVNAWFSVTYPDGKTFQIGCTVDSRLKFYHQYGNRVIAWYVNKISDAHGNYINYHYTTTNYNLRPIKIEYGLNSEKSRGITNTIDFTYNTIDDALAVPFAVADKIGKMDAYLSSITTATNGKVFRKYEFSYNNSSDGTAYKYYRLTNIKEKNGNGESLRPLVINWNYLPYVNLTQNKLGVKTETSNPIIEENSKMFLAIDINKDGISDIVRLAPGSYHYSGYGQSYDQYFTFLSVSLSKRNNDGTISFDFPKQFDLSPNINDKDIKNIIGGIRALDFDGDGFNDLVIPYYTGANGQYGEKYLLALGKNIVNGGVFSEIVSPMVKCDHTPLYETFDSNGDGKDDILYLEDESKDGFYNGAILRYKGARELGVTNFQLTIDKTPKKIFVGDYNSDGLSDLIVFYDDGYKIFYNCGGEEDSTRFSNSNAIVGTNSGNHFRIVQGDFNGDGRADFVFHENNFKYGLAINNGDGTFSINDEAISLGITNQNTNKDNNRFNLMAYDFDHDGKCDIVISKATYVHHGGLHGRNSYKNTETVWARSTGSAFVNVKDVVFGREADVECNHVFLGDFYGDGDVQLANYGHSILQNSENNEQDGIFVYRSGKDLVSSGKVSSITDGFGCTTSISYNSGTDPHVYTLTSESNYPVNEYTLPIPLVSSVSVNGGAAGTQTTNYRYSGLKLHIAGKGLLGFQSMTSENSTFGTSETTKVNKWDTTRWIPLQSTTINTIGGNTSTVATTNTVENVGGCNTYFAYPSRKVVTDLDGNTAETITTYDAAKGVPTEETVMNDNDGMYKKVVYSGYVQKAGQWLPGTVERTQKHSDDGSEFTIITNFTYNDKGDATSVVNNANTTPVVTTNEYDEYGNVTSTVNTGSMVTENKKYNVYDNTGRFVVKSYEDNSPVVNTYTYDTWGNVLTENDATNPQSVLTTTHKYDGWGNETRVSDYTGQVVTTTMDWGDTNDKKYYVLKSPNNSAWQKTWYDNCGREVMTESVGPSGVSVSNTIAYNSKGYKSSVKSTTGNLTVTEIFDYDDRGRVISDILSSGKNTTYSYGNRTVTSTIAGKSYTKTTDAWGNVVRSTDPVSEVTYKYNSNGKPSEITTNGQTTSFEYDAAGNRTSITDPDAGRTTSTYSADGKVMTETDARGITTSNTYDNQGRLLTQTIGNTVITNTYGASGNETNRLVKSSCGGNTLQYTYDLFGRVIKQVKTVNGEGSFEHTYTYNNKNQLSSESYPGGLVVDYTYDDNGFKTQATTDGKSIYHLDSYDGINTTTSFLGDFTTTQTLDSKGFLSSIALRRDNAILDRLDLSYDGATSNLSSRKRLGSDVETFIYDNLDRLIGVQNGSAKTMEIAYANNGNIISKTGIGNYYYDGNKPHAVASVDNTDGQIPSSTCDTEFNDINKLSAIHGNGYDMTLDYGPDMQRWVSYLKQNGNLKRKVVYGDDFDCVKENGSTRYIYYLDGGAIVIGQNGKFTPYLSFTDDLGSLLSVVDGNGTKVFSASYDAWGKQTIDRDDLGMIRGYSGHERLSEFDLINMNDRIYDPVLGRFLSPDNYVQESENSQNFNRYSYCLNNPLKYIDPSGDTFLELAFFSTMGAIMGGLQAEMSGENFWKGAIVGGASAAATYGIGQLFGDTGSFGHEMLRAGAHGLSSGVFAALNGENFASSFFSGAASSGIGSFAQSENINSGLMVASTTAMGGVVAWAMGGDFLQGAIQGFSIGFLNHMQHDITDNPEEGKILSRHILKKDKNYRKQVIDEIEKDGKLSFDEAYYWYGYGDGSDIHVDASKMDLGKINTLGREIGDKWTIQTLSLSGNHKVGLVYGSITIKYIGINSFIILPDRYDFDIHVSNFFSWSTIKRNIETIGAKILHGTGTPFRILFNGIYHNK